METINPGVIDSFTSYEEALDKIEFQFEYSEPNATRDDYFSILTTNALSLRSDQIDQAEEIMSDNAFPIDHDMYNEFIDKMVQFFSSYFGITIDRNESNAYLGFYYSMYKTFIVNIADFYANAARGLFLNKEVANDKALTENESNIAVSEHLDVVVQTEDDEVSSDFKDKIYDKLLDDNTNLETLIEAAMSSDIGNADYDSIKMLIDLGAISCEDDVLKSRMKKDLDTPEVQTGVYLLFKKLIQE